MYEYEYLNKATWRLFTDPDPIKLHGDLDQDSGPEHYMRISIKKICGSAQLMKGIKM
jgi:hypothetical protein